MLAHLTFPAHVLRSYSPSDSYRQEAGACWDENSGDDKAASIDSCHVRAGDIRGGGVSAGWMVCQMRSGWARLERHGALAVHRRFLARRT